LALLTPPSALGEQHVLAYFQCTSPGLAKWLLERAHKNQREGASRCFVVCDGQQNVVGYYALAAGQISHEVAPGRIRRNMPDPIPVVLLARLAVHTAWAGQGIGRGLLKDAELRTLQVSQQMGIRVLLCHAIDAPAKSFYRHFDFVESPIDPKTMMLDLSPLQAKIFGRRA
jgi:predicted N-acetyltransferase YhbS